MARPKVVITHWVHDEVIQLLEQSCIVITNYSRRTFSRDEILRQCRDAEALLAFMPDRVDQEFLDNCPKLKVIAAALKGFDNFDVTACARRGIVFSYVQDLLTGPTAELAVALLLGIGRNIMSGDRLVRGGRFAGWRPILYGTGLAGSTVGLVGMGAIGQAIADRLKPFACHLLYADPRELGTEKEDRLGLAHYPLGDLLVRSDFILVTAPLTPETQHLINRSSLALLKPGACLVNVGRGSVVDEAAVAEALASGRLAGYAADVYEFEDWGRCGRPLGIYPALLAMPDKTLFTPHLGSAVDSARKEIALEAASAILSVLNDDLSAGAVNRD